MTDGRARDDEMVERALAAEALDVEPVPDWDDVRQRATRATSRRRWVPRAAAVIVIAALLVGVAVTSWRDDDSEVLTDEPAPTSQPGSTNTTSTSTSTTTADGPNTFSTVTEGPDVGPLEFPSGDPLGDDEIVASITVPGDEFPAVEVVVLSKTTGEVIRTLADGYDMVEGGVSRFELFPDHRTVFYVVSTSACTSRIEAVPVDGSSPPVVVRDDANSIEFSSAGDRYALDTGQVCLGPAEIEVAATGGGPSTIVATDESLTYVESMVFANRNILYVGASNRNGIEGQLHLVDLETGDETITASGPTYSNLTNTRDRPYTALEFCCGDNPGSGPDVVQLDGTRVVGRRAVDVGLVQTIGYDSAGSVVVVDDPGRGVLSIDGTVVREGVLDVALG